MLPLDSEEPTRPSVTLAYGSQGSRSEASVQVEPSNVVRNGVFLRTAVAYDAGAVSLDEAARAGLKLLEKVQADVLDARLEGVTFESP